MPLKVTISGSYRKHLDRILQAKELFEDAGATVLRPLSGEVLSVDDGFVRLRGDGETAREVQQAQLQAVEGSDLLYVVNPGGYVGPSATLEIGYALKAGVRVYSQEPPFETALAAFVAGVGTPADALREAAE